MRKALIITVLVFLVCGACKLLTQPSSEFPGMDGS